MILEEDLERAVREQARLYPDRVYCRGGDGNAGCTYAPNELNETGCIVGEALLALGVPAELIARISLAGGWGPGSETGYRCIRVVLGKLVSEGARRSLWVAAVQSHQDEGKSWSEAVELADLDRRNDYPHRVDGELPW